LEDNIKPTLIEEGKKTAEKYQNKQEFEEKVKTLFESYLQTRADAFELQIKQIS
jgi:hypothetical protein